MTQAGYDIGEAPAVYQAMLDESDDRGKAEVFFFGSHPRLTERVESAQEWIDANAAVDPKVSMMMSDTP